MTQSDMIRTQPVDGGRCQEHSCNGSSSDVLVVTKHPMLLLMIIQESAETNSMKCSLYDIFLNIFKKYYPTIKYLTMFYNRTAELTQSWVW